MRKSIDKSFKRLEIWLKLRILRYNLIEIIKIFLNVNPHKQRDYTSPNVRTLKYS